MLNGVMVALQILVLSVWVRVLVEQLNKAAKIGRLLYSNVNKKAAEWLPFDFTLG